MLITDQFVMLNLPKTGSSFARTVIHEIHQRRLAKLPWMVRWLHHCGLRNASGMRSVMVRNQHLSGVRTFRDQHGTYSQIPARYRDREVISVIRNPYSRFLSMYHFRWWAKRPQLNRQLIAKHFPQFPNLSLADFARFKELICVHSRFRGRAPRAEIGDQSVQFIQMFCLSPQPILANITDEYIDSDAILDDLGPIRFLQQERLSEALADYLLEKGYSKEEAACVLNHRKVNVSKNGQQPAGWTSDLVDMIARKERLMLQVARAFGIEYDRPAVALAPAGALVRAEAG